MSHSDKMKDVLIVDNYDSFSYNLLHAVEEILTTKVALKKNDELQIHELDAFEYIILSPGPGLPAEAGMLNKIIKTYLGTKKILGVCLGLQAIVEVVGGTLNQLPKVYHGIKSEIKITYPKSLIYKDIPNEIQVGRYHSWIADSNNFPNSLRITARDTDQHIMSIEHKDHPIYAVQYHPESIMTKYGAQILKNFLSI